MTKTFADILWFPLVMFFGFLLTYTLPFHAPAPHDVTVAAAGPVSTAQIGAWLQRDPGAFQVVPVEDAAQARLQVLDQGAQAAYAVDGSQATLYTARADGGILQQAVVEEFTPIAASQHLSLRTVDLVPTVPGDSNTTGLFYLSLAWNTVPYILLIQLLLRFGRLSWRTMVAAIVGMGVFASIVGFLIGYGLGVVPGQSLIMLYAFFNFEAVAWPLFALIPFLRQYTLGAAVILFLFLSTGCCGGAVPYQMLPTFFRWLHPVMPLGNLLDAMRGIIYFDGTNMVRPTLVLCAWIATGAALVTVSALRRGRLRQDTASSATAAAVAPSTIQAPAARVLPGRNGTDNLGEPRPRMLFGRITEVTGVPVPETNVTVIDAYGRQLLRTSTDGSGCYAAVGLPDGMATVLVSPRGRTPVATRVKLASDRPVRHDLVMPDPAHGTATSV